MEGNLVVCANRECRVAEDGKCLEAYELAKCPYYGREPTDEGDEDSAREGGEDAAFDGVRLPDALSLDTARANSQLGLLPSKMVCVIGAYDSGKTSVIAGLYDLFQLGPVADILFAGSSTLHGLEIICHEARVASERNEAHSERTKRGEVRFYHVDVRTGGDLVSILIADRSGEEYEEVADLAANAATMFELRRADVITILVDGRRLSSSIDRADTIGAIPMIIQGMIENGAFDRKPNVAIVLTKNDVVVAAKKPDRVMQDFEAIVSAIRSRFEASFGELRSFVTCASPKDAKVERGLGLAELLQFWLVPRAPVRVERERHWSGRVFDSLEVEEGDIG
jgi:hypothetical protein